MARSIFVVQTNAEAGRDDEFNDWYSNVHIPEILALPGFVGAQRFLLARIPGDAASEAYAYQYLTIYEVDCAPEAAKAMLEQTKSGPSPLSMTDTIGQVRSSAYFTEMGPRVTADAVAGPATQDAS